VYVGIAHDPRGNNVSPLGIGDSRNTHVVNTRVGKKNAFYLFGPHVFATRDDEVTASTVNV
jgi:hypothetical protein